MNRWIHSICENCWRERNPNLEPYRIVEEYRDKSPENCCYCGKPHGSGIYVRADPATTLCHGEHYDPDQAA